MRNTDNALSSGENLLDKKALDDRGVPYCDFHRSRLEAQGKFPKRVKIGARVFWLESEIDAWIAEHVAKRDEVQAPPAPEPESQDSSAYERRQTAQSPTKTHER